MNDDGWRRLARARSAIDRGMKDGRWPANVVLDEDAAAMLDEQSGELASGFMSAGTQREGLGYHGALGTTVRHDTIGDVGGASRFFYVAKPSREERDLGCDVLTARQRDESRKEGNPGGDNPRNRGLQPRGNFHPTVKPLALMRWLVKLVTPPGGRVLDPFGGSGTTAMACAAVGVAFTLIEWEADYIPIIEARVRSIAPLFTERPVCQD
jgi:site-specific DNA-methyltransferase (adenine-specific)